MALPAQVDVNQQARIQLLLLSNSEDIQKRMTQFIHSFETERIHLLGDVNHCDQHKITVVLFSQDCISKISDSELYQNNWLYIYLKENDEVDQAILNLRIRVEDALDLRQLTAIGMNRAIENLVERQIILHDLNDQKRALKDLMHKVKGEYRPEGHHSDSFSTDTKAIIAENVTLISEVEKQSEALKSLAMYDPLTNIPNRQFFEESLDKMVNHAARHDHLLGLLFININKFKNINDSFGQRIGDLLLRKITKRLKKLLRGGDIIARMGGDEFAVILNQIKSTHAAGVVAWKINEELNRLFMIEGHDIYISASIGVSCYPYVGSTAESLTKNADIAMTKARNSSSKSYVYATMALQKEHDELLQIENALKSAIKRHEFSLVYQPIYEASTQRLYSFEVLLRWNSSILGMVPPDQFIPIAEDTGIIREIGAWIIDSASSQISEWYEKKIFTHRCSLNLSPVQLQEKTLLNDIDTSLKKYQLPYDLFEFELTEMAIMHEDQMTNDIMSNLCSRGATHALDDFGTGYSSISHLQCLPITTLKIDKTFVNDIKSVDETSPIVDAIIGLAKKLELKIVAEGVETAEQLEYLRQRECDYIQGYYFSKPLSADDAEQVLLAELNKK